MPPLDAILAAEQFKAEPLRMERAAATRLAKAYNVVYLKLQGQIKALSAEIDAMVAAGEEPRTWKVKKLEDLQ